MKAIKPRHFRYINDDYGIMEWWKIGVTEIIYEYKPVLKT